MTISKNFTLTIALLCWALLLAGLGQVAAETNLDDSLGDLDCTTARSRGLAMVADHFYAGEPDQALSIVIYIQEKCSTDEHIRRIQILGSIWDDSFEEDIYGYEIIDDLAWRADPTNADPRFAVFDSFTTDLANQLLPHVDRESLAEFFCLFHSGRVDAAYRLLQGDELRGTDLAAYYHSELEILANDRVYGTLGIFGNLWRPSGDLARLGDHSMAGLVFGGQYRDWFGRFNMGFRFARSRYPYYVDHGGQTGWSDRTIGAKLGIDLGAYLFQRGRHETGLFLGAGFDNLIPFHEEGEISVSSFFALAGLEYKVWLGEHRLWNISLDLRKEWYDSWSGVDTDMSGGGWDFRFGVGIAPGNAENQERRGNLGYR